MKSIFTALTVLIGHFIFAQQNPTNLEINSPSEVLSCENDISERNIRIEYNGAKIGTYQSKGCKFNLTKEFELGQYTVIISGLAFQEEKLFFEITESNRSQITLTSNPLKENNTELSEVTIYGNRRQFIKIDSDKTTINVKENGMLNSGSALDAVKKLPGVVKAPGGGLSLNGKGVGIYIDGAPSSLSGTDLENYLASLPASAIEKVELIYNPGAAYDANSSGSIINIVTSSKKMKGINASFNMNYNFNEYHKPSPQILLNGKEKNLSWQTMFGVNYIENENLNITRQEFTFFSPAQNLTQSNFTRNIWRNLYWRTGTNYKLSDRSNVLFNYNLGTSHDTNLNDVKTTGAGIDFLNNGFTKSDNTNHELSVQYKTKLDTLGTTFDIIAFSNFFKRNPLTKSVSFEDGINTYNNSDLNFRLENYYLKYDFAFPFKEWDFSINTGGKYNINQIRNLGRYNFESNTDDIFDSGQFGSVIDFNYSEKNLAFYVESRKKLKKFYFTAGLRFEDYSVKREASTIADRIEFSNTNFFPNLSIMYEINKNMNVSSSYSKKISQPGYNTIDPNNNSLFNRYNTSEGNIALRPIFFNNYELKFSAFDFMQMGINYAASKDNNQFIIEAEDGELVSNRTAAAFDEMNIFSTYINFPIPLDYFFKGKEEFTRRMNTIDKMNYIFASISYNKTTTEGYPLGHKNTGAVVYGAQSQLLLPWAITNNMNFFYIPKGVWEIYRVDKPIQQFDISFNKEFMNKKLKLGLHCFDVFNANQINAFMTGKNLNTHFYEKQDTRTFRFSLTYNFGNLKLNKEDTNINTDKVNSGGGMMK